MCHKNKNAKSYCGLGKNSSGVDSWAAARVKTASLCPEQCVRAWGVGLVRTEKINEIRNERFRLVLSDINQKLLTRRIIVTCPNGKREKKNSPRRAEQRLL